MARPAQAPLRLDVAAAVRAAEARRPPADVQLSTVIVTGRRRQADALPCIGCDGRVIVPMHRLRDFADVVGSLLELHPAARPDSPEDRAIAFAHENTCIDGSGCLLPK